MHIEISKETGLPEVPDPYYWEVVELPDTPYYGSRLRVSLKKKRRRFRDSVIDYASTAIHYADAFHEARELGARVRDVARRLYADNRFLFEEDTELKEARLLVGKYPPKRLP